MSKEVENVLTNGLHAGYAGGKPENVTRGTVDGKVSHIKQVGSIYHDEWFVGTRVGGGQELVVFGDQKFTRLYAGGTPDTKALESLGITTKDVSRYLKSKILELGNETRLFQDCTPEPDGYWQYAYRIATNSKSIGLTTAMESIHYQTTPVHLHAFILSPIK